MEGILKNLQANLDKFEKGTSQKIPENVYESLKKAVIKTGESMNIEKTKEQIIEVADNFIEELKLEEKKLRKHKRQQRNKVGQLFVILTKTMDKMIQKIIAGVSTAASTSSVVLTIAFMWTILKNPDFMGDLISGKEIKYATLLGQKFFNIEMTLIMFWAVSTNAVHWNKNAIKKASTAVVQFSRSFREYGDQKRQRARLNHAWSKALKSVWSVWEPIVVSVVSKFSKDPKKFFNREKMFASDEKRQKKVGKHFSSRNKRSKNRKKKEKENPNAGGEAFKNIILGYHCASLGDADKIQECLKVNGFVDKVEYDNDNRTPRRDKRHRHHRDNKVLDNNWEWAQYVPPNYDTEKLKLHPREKIQPRESEKHKRNGEHVTKQYLDNNLKTGSTKMNNWYLSRSQFTPDENGIFITDTKNDSNLVGEKPLFGDTIDKNAILYILKDKAYYLTKKQLKDYVNYPKQGDYLIRTDGTYTILGPELEKNQAFLETLRQLT